MINFVINNFNTADFVSAMAFAVNENVRKTLFDYAMQGEWAKAKKLYQKNPWLRSEKITVDGDTALHLAVRDRNDKVVEEMVKLVTFEQCDDVLKSQNEQGNTPLHLSASIGNDSMCNCFLSNYKDLLSVEGENPLLSVVNKEGENPLFLAARFGQINAFLCLAPESESGLRRNKKGETILHSAMAAGHFELAYLIIGRYENLIWIYDEKGVSPLHLLAKQPTAFRSGTRLSMMDKIIYHCTIVTPLCLEKSDGPDKRQTPWNNINIKGLFSFVVKFIKICINPSSGAKAEKARSDTDEENRLTLGQGTVVTPLCLKKSDGPNRQTPWNNNIKGLFSFVVKFIKICINPSSGAKVEKARSDTNEENRLSTLDQGPDQRNHENGKRGGLSRRNFPMNYDTCFNFITLLIKAFFIIFLGIGRSYLDKIRKKKENHVLSVKILKRILENARGHLYDSTGTNPLNQDKTISYKVDEGLSGEKPELNQEFEESFKEVVHKVEEVQRAPDLLIHKVLEEVQRSTDSIHKLLEQAQTNGLPVVNADKSQKLNKSLKEDPNWGLMETMSKAIHQTAKKLDEELFPEKREEEKLETPMLIAAKNGIVEMVESILACFPEAILDANTEKKNVVLLAVEKGHPHLYNALLKKATNLTDIVFGAVDDHGNSALHLAAMFTDPRPWLTPGAALQMQWEIRWFQYVKNSKPSNFFPAVNQKGESPQQIFTDKHKDLVKNGGEWLNNTATSCSVVSTLIATVAFATSSSLPGGNRENTGMPILELKPAFHLFTISSLIALCFSITATIMFLAILTSRLREKDFAKDLPVKLLAGLTSLFVSILAILVSFCSAHFFVLQKELRDYALLIYALTCLLATLFAIAQLPLYIDLTWTTFSTVPQPPLEDNT